MIKFKIKEVSWIRKSAELPGPPPVLCPRPTGGGGGEGGGHPTPPPPLRHLPVFLKPLCQNFACLETLKVFSRCSLNFLQIQPNIIYKCFTKCYGLKLKAYLL